MGNLKSYLQLTRAHAAPLEVIPAMLGAALAVGGLWELSVLLWGVAGLLYHSAGYAMNSYEDWKEGHDKRDEYKSHHPLNTGDLSKRQAKKVTGLLVAIAAVYVVGLIGTDLTAMIVLVIGVSMGFTYNLIGKKTSLRFIPISIAHTTLFVIPFLAEGGDLNSDVLLLGSSFVFLWVSFQIGVGESIKDLTDYETPNFLRDVTGVSLGGIGRQTGYNPHAKAILFSILLKVAGLSLAFPLFDVLNEGEPNSIVPTVMIMLCLICVSLTIGLMILGEFYMRDRRVTMISGIEAITVFVFILACTSVITPLGAITLIILSVLWVFTTNKIAWGTILSPRT